MHGPEIQTWAHHVDGKNAQLCNVLNQAKKSKQAPFRQALAQAVTLII